MLSTCFFICCVKYREFKELKANHNTSAFNPSVSALCQISRIQGTESKSQHSLNYLNKKYGCVKYREFKELKANHNTHSMKLFRRLLCQISRIQGTESKSQHPQQTCANTSRCVKYREFKELKANHNIYLLTKKKK